MPFEVLIAGAGPAGLEAALALRDLAGERVRITLLAPEDELTYRPVSVAEPFALGATRRYPLDAIARDVGAARVVDRLASVDPEAHLVRTSGGREVRIRRAARRPRRGRRAGARARDHVLGPRRRRGGPRHRPGRRGRLHAARRVRRPARDHLEPADLRAGAAHGGARHESDLSPELHLITPEDVPLAVFGTQASQSLVAAARAGRHPAAHRRLRRGERAWRARAPAKRRARRGGPDRRPSAADGPAGRGAPRRRARLPADRRVRPRARDARRLGGRRRDRLPAQAGRDRHPAGGRRRDRHRRARGRGVEPEPFRPLLRGILLTGTGAWWLRSEPGGGGGEGELAGHALWWPPSKVAGRWLSPYLAERDEFDSHAPPRGTPLEIRLAHTTAPEGAHASAVHVVDVLALEQPSSPGERDEPPTHRGRRRGRGGRRGAARAARAGRAARGDRAARAGARPGAPPVVRRRALSASARPSRSGRSTALVARMGVAGAARRARRGRTATAASPCSRGGGLRALRPPGRRGRRAPARRAAGAITVRRTGRRRRRLQEVPSPSRAATPSAWPSPPHPACAGLLPFTSSPAQTAGDLRYPRRPRAGPRRDAEHEPL